MGNVDIQAMDAPTVVLESSWCAPHPKELVVNTPMTIGFASGGHHKIARFIAEYERVSDIDVGHNGKTSRLTKKPIHVVQIPTGSPDEPDQYRAATLVRDKARTIFRHLQTMHHGKWNRFPKVDEIAVTDVNVRWAVSGENFVPMRKLKGAVTDDEAIKHIVGLFRTYGNDATVDIQTEAGVGFYKEARPDANPDIVIVERADLQLSPPVVNALKNEDFVRAFIAFCHQRQGELEANGINSGAQALDSPSGFKQDLLVMFLRERRFNTQTYHIDPDSDIQIHVHKDGRSDLDALIAVTQGCGIRQMKEITRWIARGMQRMKSDVVIESEDPIARLGK